MTEQQNNLAAGIRCSFGYINFFFFFHFNGMSILRYLHEIVHTVPAFLEMRVRISSIEGISLVTIVFYSGGSRQAEH